MRRYLSNRRSTRPAARRTAVARASALGALALGIVLAIAAGGLPGAARAHEYWLAPSSYDGAPGRPVTIAAVAGTGFHGEPKPWSPARGVRFLARTSKPLDLSKVAAVGEIEWARFAPSDRGGALLAFESDFTPITLEAAAFDRYLRDEGLNDALAARDAAAR